MTEIEELRKLNAELAAMVAELRYALATMVFYAKERCCGLKIADDALDRSPPAALHELLGPTIAAIRNAKETLIILNSMHHTSQERVKRVSPVLGQLAAELARLEKLTKEGE